MSPTMTIEIVLLIIIVGIVFFADRWFSKEMKKLNEQLDRLIAMQAEIDRSLDKLEQQT